VLHVWEDDNVPVLTEDSETFKGYAARLAATATVQAATGMSDDDNESMTFPLFDGTQVINHHYNAMPSWHALLGIVFWAVCGPSCALLALPVTVLGS
jgi:N-acetylglucosamine-6-phosphate deacetylase